MVHEWVGVGLLCTRIRQRSAERVCVRRMAFGKAIWSRVRCIRRSVNDGRSYFRWDCCHHIDPPRPLVLGVRRREGKRRSRPPACGLYITLLHQDHLSSRLRLHSCFPDNHLALPSARPSLRPFLSFLPGMLFPTCWRPRIPRVPPSIVHS
jgi:hypothetical protein